MRFFIALTPRRYWYRNTFRFRRLTRVFPAKIRECVFRVFGFFPVKFRDPYFIGTGDLPRNVSFAAYQKKSIRPNINVVITPPAAAGAAAACGGYTCGGFGGRLRAQNRRDGDVLVAAVNNNSDLHDYPHRRHHHRRVRRASPTNAALMQTAAEKPVATTNSRTGKWVWRPRWSTFWRTTAKDRGRPGPPLDDDKDDEPLLEKQPASVDLAGDRSSGPVRQRKKTHRRRSAISVSSFTLLAVTLLLFLITAIEVTFYYYYYYNYITY